MFLCKNITINYLFLNFLFIFKKNIFIIIQKQQNYNSPVVIVKEQSWKNPQKGDLASLFFSREERRKDKLKIHQSLESRNLVIRKFSDRSTGS